MWAVVAAALLAVSGCVGTFLPKAPTAKWSPWDAESLPPDQSSLLRPGLADTALSFYQRHMRRLTIPGDGGCKFGPSCSVYARQAFTRYGAWIGTAMTVARLFVRETTARPDEFAPTLCDGYPCLYDPAF